MNAAHQEALLAEIRQRFVSRKFVADIVVIPDYYLRGKTSFEGLAGVQRDALRKFESDVHEEKANVRVVSNRSGGIGGGGSLDWLILFVLLPLAVMGTRKRGSGRT